MTHWVIKKIEKNYGMTYLYKAATYQDWLVKANIMTKNLIKG